MAAVELLAELPFFFRVEHGEFGTGVYRNVCASHQFQQAQRVRHLLLHPRVARDQSDAEEVDVVGL